jgi:hypothetical protein
MGTKKETKTTSSVSANKSNFDSVVVHPLVLLSVVDHFKRVDEVINNEACFFSSFFPFLRSDDDDDVNLSLFISLSLCSLERDDFIDIFSLLFLTRKERTWQRKRDPKERKGNPFLKASEKKSYLMLRGGRKALLTLRQQFSSCSATTTTKKATTKAKSKNSKEQPCSALAIIADAGHGLGDFFLHSILVVFFPRM